MNETYHIGDPVYYGSVYCIVQTEEFAGWLTVERPDGRNAMVRANQLRRFTEADKHRAMAMGRPGAAYR